MSQHTGMRCAIRLAVAGAWCALAGCTTHDLPSPPPTSKPRVASPPQSGEVSPIAEKEAEKEPTPPVLAKQNESSKVASRFHASFRYPRSGVHSPLSSEVVRQLQAIAARDPALKDDVFAKVGDSITFSDDFMKCVGHPRMNLASFAPRLTPVIRHFSERKKATNPFTRRSKTATIGWSAWQVVAGEHPPLWSEWRAIQPRYSLVMFGTNDIEMKVPHHFFDKLFDAVEWQTLRGTVPVLFTIPARKDKAEAALAVPRYNNMIRGVAQALGVVLVDYHQRLSELPGKGLGPDGIHPTTFVGRKGRAACDFSQKGLEYGYNQRNLLALEALARVQGVVGGSQIAPDRAPEQVPVGSFESPAPVSSRELPLVDWLPASAAPSQREDYPCKNARSAAGAEQVYRIQQHSRETLRISADDRGLQSDLFLLSSDGSRCLRSGKQRIVATLEPGEYLLVIDGVSSPDEGLAGAKAPSAAARGTLVVVQTTREPFARSN